jgi:hypothetical protein
MPRLAKSLAAVLLPLPILVVAQSVDRNTLLRDARKSRLDARDLRANTRFFTLVPEGPEEPSTTLSLGLATDSDESDTRTISTPFALTYQRGGKNDWWKFKVQGDGYMRSREASIDTVNGFADVQLKVLHLLGAGFTGGVGLTLPTKGAVGSRAASQSGKLIYEHTFASAWTLLASGSLIHANGSPDDQSPYIKVLYAELGWEFKTDHVLIPNLTHTRRGGTASSTELGFECDFPLPFVEKTKKIDASVSLIRGITSGSRHTSVEFDLSHKF